MREKLESLEKYEPTYLGEIQSEPGEIAVMVQKVLHTR
jgi:hypothetical protein